MARTTEAYRGLRLASHPYSNTISIRAHLPPSALDPFPLRLLQLFDQVDDQWLRCQYGLCVADMVPCSYGDRETVNRRDAVLSDLLDSLETEREETLTRYQRLERSNLLLTSTWLREYVNLPLSTTNFYKLRRRHTQSPVVHGQKPWHSIERGLESAAFMGSPYSESSYGDQASLCVELVGIRSFVRLVSKDRGHRRYRHQCHREQR